ncbi:MAG: DUF4397 domain-containing protein, partial [Bacteroidota bacterium]|nr:DUF4397 domain-containing protein [Bacteroidota bacterium]
MKKLFILFISLSLVTFSCNDDPEPQPEVIRAFCYLYHFIPELGSVIWEADGVEVPNERVYAYQFAGAIILESESEEIAFAVKHSGTNEVLASELFQLEKNRFYNIIAGGSADEPTLFIREIDTGQPQAGTVKFQVLHSAAGQNSIDVYMGDTTTEKRIVTDLAYLDLTAPVEAEDSDARASITVSKHSEEFHQDSVL